MVNGHFLIDLNSMWTNNVHMKTASVRDLRNNFSTLETWLGEGEQISIEKRGQAIAILSPLSCGDQSRMPILPDFQARLKKLWGERVFSAEDIKTMRNEELEGEEG